MNGFPWPVAMYAALVVGLIGGMVLLSWLLGERHRQPQRDLPYESGAVPVTDARLRYRADYYLVAVLFLLFDVEAAFLFAWAVAFRDLGWGGYLSAALFIVVLALGLVYIWKEGGLDWNRSRLGDRGREARP